MKNVSKLFGIIALSVIIVFSMAGCDLVNDLFGKEDEGGGNIVNKTGEAWVATPDDGDGGYRMGYIFNSNGTFDVAAETIPDYWEIGMSGTYKTKGNKLTLSNIYGDDDESESSYKYKVSGNDLTIMWTDEEDGEEGSVTLKKMNISIGVFTAPASHTPLTADEWTDGSITTSVKELWYSFDVSVGKTYYVWWSNYYNSNGKYTADVWVQAFYGNGRRVYSDEDYDGWHYPMQFTATSSIKVYLRVTSYDSDDIGTFAIAYSTENKRPTTIPADGIFNVSNADEWDAATTAIATNGNDQEYTINVTSDFAIAGLVAVAGYPQSAFPFGSASGIKVTIQGGKTVSLSSDGSLLRINANQTVVLGNITLQGLEDNTSPLVYVSGALEMKEGAVITGNTNTASNTYGGGVYVGGTTTTSGTFVMDGGKISGNAASNNTFGGGGGVYVGGGTFTMNGGEISDNTASSTYGGGVYNSNSGTFTMKGGEISGNTARNDGGGVYNSGTFTMKGGKISDNTATGNGGGVSGGTFDMEDGEISGNTASFGGGVDVSGRTFTMKGGKISGNTSTGNTSSNGGGVYVGIYGGTITMSGGEISGNTANGSGGGVYMYSGTFTMSDGEISGNTASGNTTASGDGGGVYVGMSGGTLTMKGGEISGNTAKTSGGGVYVGVKVGASGGTFTIVTGTIYGSDGDDDDVKNTAPSGAALYSGGTAQYGTFTGDTWTSNGDLTTTDDTIEVLNGALR